MLAGRGAHAPACAGCEPESWPSSTLLLHAPCRYYLNGADAYRLKLLLPASEEEQEAKLAAAAAAAQQQQQLSQGQAGSEPLAA